MIRSRFSIPAYNQAKSLCAREDEQLTAKRTHRKEWRPFGEAREFVHSLGLKSQTDWRQYCKSGERPEDIPSSPDRVYDEYKDLADWIGHINARSMHGKWRPFKEAREFVHGLKLLNKQEWDEYARSGKKPADIPMRPETVYKTEFKGMGDWLGTGYVRPVDREYRSFFEAREFARTLGLRGLYEWRDYVKTGNLPTDIPSNPGVVYGSEFRGWGDWLGVVGRWSKVALLALLSDLRPRLPNLEESELYTILQQGGALAPLHVTFGKSSPMQVLKDTKGNEGREIERTIRSISDDEIAAQEEKEIVDEGIAEYGNVAKGEAFTDETEHAMEIDETTLDAGDNSLPTLATHSGLRVIDSLAELSCGLDDDAAEYLVANRVSALWERYISEDRTTVDELLNGNDGGRWFNEIKTRFLSEVAGVETSRCLKDGSSP